MKKGIIDFPLQSRVLWFLLAAYVLGTFISKAAGLDPQAGLYLLPICAVIIAPSLFSEKKVFMVLLVLAFVALGFARNDSSRAVYEKGLEIAEFAGGPPVRLVLEVDRPPDRRPRYSVFYGTVKKIKRDGRWLSFDSPLRLAVAGDLPRVYRGDRLMALASLSIPRTYENPGGFDYEAWLARRGIAVTGWVDSPRLVHKIETSGNRLPHTVDMVREKYIDYLHRVDGKGGALLAALLAGDRKSLPKSVENIFESSGLSHILAVSGLHLGLVAASFYFLFYSLFKRLPLLSRRLPALRVAALLTVFPVIAYAFLTGMRIPTQRALIMVLVFLFALASERQRDTWNALALAALAVLFVWPEALYEASFQLSFTCLAGILYAMPRQDAVYRGRRDREEEILLLLEREAVGKRQVLRRPARYFAGLFAVSAAALWAIFPLQVFFFHESNPLSPLYNLVAVPVCGLVIIPLGLLFSILGIVFPSGGEVLLGLLGGVGSALIETMEFFLRHARTNMVLPSLSRLGVICWYAGGAVLLEGILAYRTGCFSWRYFSALKTRGERLNLWPAPVLEARRSRVWAALAVGLLLMTVPLADLFRSRDPFADKGAMVAMIEVGQGQSFLLRTDPGRYILVDGGGFYFSDWDVGKNVVAPCLLSLGLTRLDAVVLSHAHPDHGRGLKFVLANFEVGEFWVGPGANGLSRELVDIAVSRNINIRRLDESSGLFSFGPAKISVLHPPAGDESSEDLNNRSLVLRLETDNFTILLTGDIEEEAEALLVEKYGPHGKVKARALAAQVMSVPHHGSKTSSTDAFLDAVSPEFALVSGAGPSRTGLPSPEVLEKYRDRGVNVLRTDIHGFSGVYEKEGTLIRLE